MQCKKNKMKMRKINDVKTKLLFLEWLHRKMRYGTKQKADIICLLRRSPSVVEGQGCGELAPGAAPVSQVLPQGPQFLRNAQRRRRTLPARSLPSKYTHA